jgi:hypothetical protein
VEPSLESLEARRKQLYRELEALGDFRRGTISVNFRKCGKSNCACAQKDHPGHGPQYLWNAGVGGKTKARNHRNVILGEPDGKLSAPTATRKGAGAFRNGFDRWDVGFDA